MDSALVGHNHHSDIFQPIPTIPIKTSQVDIHVLLDILHGYGWDLRVGQSINDSLSEVLAGGIATHVRSSNL